MTYGQSAAQRYECHDREPNISHPARPNSVNKHFIIWLIRVENLENLFLLKKYAINWRVRDNHKNDSTIKTFPLFFRVRTGNSHFIEKRDIFFFHFCSRLSLIFLEQQWTVFLFLILYFFAIKPHKCTRARRLFPDRESVSRGLRKLSFKMKVSKG